MKTKHWIGVAATTLSLSLSAASSSLAATLHNGWLYTIDPSYDSYGTVNGNVQVGGTIYEDYGMAIKEDSETGLIWVALNTNTPLEGNVTGPELCLSNGTCFPVRNNSIASGDLFFDFSGTGNYQAAFDSGLMYGVRFTPYNDSLVDVGVYANVTGDHVGRHNAGFWNLGGYNAYAKQEGNLGNLDTWMGDLRWNDPYFDPYTSQGFMPNVIGSGQRIGDVTLRSQEELQQAGFDPSFFFELGSNIMGFSFQKPLEWTGNFIATLLKECLNDGMALLGSFNPPPPEPEPNPVIDDGCAVTLGELKALAPDEIDGSWKIFYDVLSHQWYDPPAYTGFEFTTIGGTQFKQILDFPCGIAAEDKFSIIVPDINGQSQTVTLNGLKPGDRVDFVELFGQPISTFTAVGVIDLPKTVRPFSLQLGLDAEIGSFKIRMIEDLKDLPDYVDLSKLILPPVQTVPEPTVLLGLITVGFLGTKLKKRIQ
ncbi:PEP-CTERM sorting domain-containing protein [Spirulina subsalsa FACHB-351]|uniref:PEP-CTERM sorting domain-containing protein n=1 Tax=Spirulina subsalsa FACHB-351 TaxID=234711 RepID=A0ABT3L2G6_9CYAN|nr:XDD3 family exosortase-dependent surface protein [Spirulina subsalsa]MCW6035699.1 PEP-CTERM sorting domain-containing protein [Spirulina subsalsa FACHB-351]